MKINNPTPLSPGRYVSPQAELLELNSLYGILADSSELESYIDDGQVIQW